MHKARGRAARSNFSDSPKADSRVGVGTCPPHSVFGNCLLRKFTKPFFHLQMGLFFFITMKLRRQHKRKTWQIELPTYFLLLRSHVKKKKDFFFS